MKDIVVIESIRCVSDGIEVKAVVEEMRYIKGSQTLYDPPEYAPALCRITIPLSHLPEDTDYTVMSEDELEEVLNRNVDLDSYEWIIDVESGYDNDDPLPNVYF